MRHPVMLLRSDLFVSETHASSLPPAELTDCLDELERA